MRNFLLIAALMGLMMITGCNKPSKVEQYHADKHVRDSVALVEQVRTLNYYQAQLDSLMPRIDSLLTLFKYEKNEKYQDHGYYVLTSRNGTLRVMVRDDGQEDVVAYRNGKRVLSDGEWTEEKKASDADYAIVEQAQELQILMKDIFELQNRIRRTSLEVQKYEKRLQK